jgi:hypothetical protein
LSGEFARHSSILWLQGERDEFSWPSAFPSDTSITYYLDLDHFFLDRLGDAVMEGTARWTQKLINSPSDQEQEHPE